MDHYTASRILRDVHLMPGWSMQHFRVTNDTMLLHFEFWAPNSSDYPRYTQRSIAGNPDTYLDLRDYDTPDELIRAVIDAQLKVWEHEVREFTRYGPTWDAPFHPHTDRGITAWKASENAKVGV